MLIGAEHILAVSSSNKPGTEVQSVTVANTGSSTTWANGNPSYRLTFNTSALTECLAHDAEDWELEVESCPGVCLVT